MHFLAFSANQVSAKCNKMKCFTLENCTIEILSVDTLKKCSRQFRKKKFHGEEASHFDNTFSNFGRASFSCKDLGVGIDNRVTVKNVDLRSDGRNATNSFGEEQV